MTNHWNRLFYTPVLPLGAGRSLVTASEEHIGLSRRAAAEGMVLLKNEGGVLPLKKGSRIALFGKACVDTVKGGGGSGDVTVPYLRTFCQGMQIKEAEGKVSLFSPLIDFYEKEVSRQYAAGAEPGMTVEPALPKALLDQASDFADIAVLSICRFSGEGWDRKTVVSDNYDLADGEKRMFELSAKLFENGDFCLTRAELALVSAVCGRFSTVIAVLNIGGTMETGWFKDNEKIQGALLAWQGGIEGGLAASDILVGDENPSGHLSDTFAKTLEDYPSTEGFHASPDYVDYSEDIYVGYRYFETIPGAREKVAYPFGYGLSYSDFEVKVLGAEKDGEEICIRLRVKNLSGISGKQVVQIYASLPQGKLGKPAFTLAAFDKTKLLAGGEQQDLTLRFLLPDLASYDDLGKVSPSAWILEKGTYRFYLGEHVEKLTELFSFTLESDIITQQLSPKCSPKKLARRLTSDGSFEELPTGEYPPRELGLTPPKDPMRDYPIPAVRAVPSRQISWISDPSEGKILLSDVKEKKHSLEEFLDQLPIEDLISLTGGQPNTGVANTFGWGNLPDYGVPNAMTADGPAGLRVDAVTGVSATAWPCATMLACTWNRSLLESVGRAAAREVKENNIGIWLAPAINIHRSPLCGRNFEYYSEDPCLTGSLAGALVRGVQSQQIAACVKHFCVNNKETNRKGSDSRVSERALREIYLKAFEMIVRSEQPWSIMSSYNLLNGTQTSENRELLTDILRGEWGYEGLVTTDWWTAGEHYLECRAGNDIKMGAGFPGRVKEAYDKGLISREELSLNARRVLELILRLD